MRRTAAALSAKILMLSDGVMHLVERGVITGRRKTLHQGKIVSSFAAGTHADFMRGAALAHGGKPILALPSTALRADGPHSRIVPSVQTEIIGVGRYLTTPDTRTAEMAFVIRDDWQHLGLGTHLVQRLVEIAGRSGIRHFHADVLPQNSGMLKIFHRSGLNTETLANDGVVRVTRRLQE